MQTLILLRHGEAAPAGAGGDIHRVLTAKGEQDAAAAGRALARLAPRLDVVLVSPAKRTQQTWAAASTALGDPQVVILKALLHTDARTILAAAEDADGDSVMVVAHNPGLADLADQLARASGSGEARDGLAATGFAPATAAVFIRASDGWRFEAFLPPENAA